MKTLYRILIIKALMLFALSVHAQDFYNPGITAENVSPSPLVFPGGTGIASFNLVNADLLPLQNPNPSGANSPLLVTISLTNVVPQNPSAAPTGGAAGYFSWVYIASLNSFQGTQIADIPAFISQSIEIPFVVTAPSSGPPLGTPSNGFAASLTPPSWSNDTNLTNDDAKSAFTWTIDAMTCSADNGTLSFGN